jgi:hypothetical protein
MGLDQVKAYFPMCVANAKAIVEKRYDAFMDFTSIQTGTHTRIYLPFLVSPGDQECGWVNSTMAISSSVNPSVSGQSVTFAAIVSPIVVTGTAQFFDGTAAIGSGAISGGDGHVLHFRLGRRHPLDIGNLQRRQQLRRIVSDSDADREGRYNDHACFQR